MTLLSGADPAAIEAAARQLAAGALVAFPTETVYGLGARADDDAAVARIYAAKGRPAGHPLIVHVPDRLAAEAFVAASPDVGEAQAEPGAQVARHRWPAAAERLAAAFWPGPVTLILPRRQGVATRAAGAQDSIGLRMPAHPVALALLRAAQRLGVPGVAAPSANRFGRISATTAAHVASEFGEALMVLDGGACDIGIESTIIDCTRSKAALLRPGQLGRKAIEAVLGCRLAGAGADAPRASGTLASHYAPATPLFLVPPGDLLRQLAQHPARGSSRGLAVYSRVAPPTRAGLHHRLMPGNAATVAHELFAVLREFDALDVAAIWVEQPPPGAAWAGVRDRLQRAAA